MSVGKYYEKLPFLVGLVTIGGVTWYVFSELERQKRELIALKKEIVNLKSLLTYQANQSGRSVGGVGMSLADAKALLASTEPGHGSKSDSELESESESDFEDEDGSGTSENENINEDGNENRNKKELYEETINSFDLESDLGINVDDLIMMSKVHDPDATAEDIIQNRITTISLEMLTVPSSHLAGPVVSPAPEGKITELHVPVPTPSPEPESVPKLSQSQSTCPYIWKYGKKRKTACAQESVTDSEYCHKHKKQLDMQYKDEIHTAPLPPVKKTSHGPSINLKIPGLKGK